MGRVVFHQGNVSTGYSTDFDPWLFHRDEFLKTQTSEGWIVFRVLEEKHHRVLATFPVHINGELAKSPVRSPFGSIQLSDEISEQELFQFLEYAERTLVDRGVRKIVIKNPPDIYQSSQASVFNSILFNLNYRVTTAEIGSYLQITDGGFEKSLHNSERRKLKLTRAERFKFSIESKTNISTLYQFIKACREERGYALSMTEQEVTQLLHDFPQSIKLYSVQRDNVLAAATIAIDINAAIRYNFYPAHAKAFDTYSPAVMLTHGIYEQCHADNVKILDLGTSAIDGKPNFSLLEFKRRLGGQTTMKLTFEKVLS